MRLKGGGRPSFDLEYVQVRRAVVNLHARSLGGGDVLEEESFGNAWTAVCSVSTMCTENSGSVCSGLRRNGLGTGDRSVPGVALSMVLECAEPGRDQDNGQADMRVSPKLSLTRSPRRTLCLHGEEDFASALPGSGLLRVRWRCVWMGVWDDLRWGGKCRVAKSSTVVPLFLSFRDAHHRPSTAILFALRQQPAQPAERKRQLVDP